MSEIPHNLPPQTTPFVGRRRELAEIGALLARPECRLLSLVGPGGIGKTRLALEVAAQQLSRYPDGIFFVPLQALEAPDLIVESIVKALGFHVDYKDNLQQQLLRYLRDQRLLLVIDNFEHLLEGAQILSTILAHAPGVDILVTSREALNLFEESVWLMTGMHFPDPEMAQLDARVYTQDYSAVDLFVQSARRIKADFSFEDEKAGVLKICALVEGMPLGIELAAAWVRTLSCDQIAEEIKRSLDFLTSRARNIQPRHQSMRVVLDHSWRLLTPDEQAVFKRLSVFRGSFTRDAAAFVSGADLSVLSALVDKSLVKLDVEGRYVLHELIHQYAERQLNVSLDESGEARSRHSQYYMTFLERRWEQLLGSDVGEALCEIEMEIRNVRAAWGWAAVVCQRAEDLQRGMDSLWFFYDTRGWYREGDKIFALAAESIRGSQLEQENALLLARILARQAVFCNSLNCFDKAKALFNESIAIFQRYETRHDLAFALSRLAETYAFEWYFDQAQHFFEEALTLYRQIGDRWGEAFVLNWLGYLYDEPEQRSRCRQQSRAIFSELRSHFGLAISLPAIGFLALNDKDYLEALRLGQEALALCQKIGIRWGISMCLQLCGFALHGLHRDQEAVQCFGEALEIALETHLPHYIALSSWGIARSLAVLGRTELALGFYAIDYRYLADLGPGVVSVDVAVDVPDDLLAAVRERAGAIDPETAARQLLDEVKTQYTGAEPLALAPGASAVINLPALGAPLDPRDLLTEREVEVLRLVAGGKSNRQIASELFLALGTVKWYLNQIFAKLQVTNRTAAAARARELGLLQ